MGLHNPSPKIHLLRTDFWQPLYTSETSKDKGAHGLLVHPEKEMKILLRDLTLEEL
jgi:hypothetical protein